MSSPWVRTAGAGEQKRSNSAFIYQKLSLSSGILVGDDLADNGVGCSKIAEAWGRTRLPPLGTCVTQGKVL